MTNGARNGTPLDACSECSHAAHGGECGVVVGYDHLNGEHDCGCPGPAAIGAGPLEIDWSQPCPAPLRCPNQTLCPPACQRAGNREGNKILDSSPAPELFP